VTVLLFYLTTGNPVLPPKPSVVGSEDSASKTVRLFSRNGRSFTVSLDGLRTRFCAGEGSGPCYDYTAVYVQLDNCGVTAYPLSEITHFETKGEFPPNHCIRATQSARLSTAEELDRKVYMQDRYWSLVGTEVGTGETIVLPFGDLVYFESQ
jgi:hypothetical protein